MANSQLDPTSLVNQFLKKNNLVLKLTPLQAEIAPDGSLWIKMPIIGVDHLPKTPTNGVVKKTISGI